MAQMKHILQMNNVTKRFPGVLALDNATFSLQPGEVHALIGENGAGKSTLIKILTGVYQPDSGQIIYDGKQVMFNTPGDAQKAGISTIYQEVNLIPLFSVAQNIFLGREPRSRLGLIDFKRMNQEAATILERLGIYVDLTQPIKNLGLGVQQMVAIARAVSVNARVVIMDEPTSSLDAQEVSVLFRVVNQLREQGIGIIFVSHRLDELYEICETITVMRDGKVVRTGRIRDIPKVELISLMLGRELIETKHDVSKSKSSECRTSQPVLSVRGLKRENVLNDVSFDVHPGEVLGLAGLLGSGRTETVKAIFGADPVDSGTIEVSGIETKMRSPASAIKYGIALLSEDRKSEGILPNLSIRENIIAAVRPHLAKGGLVSKDKEDEIVEMFIKRLNIKASSPEQPVRELSGGNQQKVLLARWLAINPKLLILDDPTRGIDVGAKAEVQKLIQNLAKQQFGIILISSDTDEVLDGSDRLVVLREGTTIGEADSDSITEGDLMNMLAGSVQTGVASNE
ncbi:sugar ABC transporter ATP-binding protein [Fodinisporobacter ferrooxydans]|uniref:Sugar ABC transporter ATP-binding protein n=1 Tax=Fodinisporobacter ferrooxydans TaxID=2901836 RepID=A0ABY4CN95_9BACL|nr:sugar ABC transporter ATP-binding protein [Alicyclobacillaceae bacterium MYW30-H2]